MKRTFCILAVLSQFIAGLKAQPNPPVHDFGVKAMFVDCRAEVMTLDALKALAKDIAGKGMNAMVIEWEATFPFDKHATLCNRYAFTAGEVRDLVAWCAGLGVEVIPLQNCFGHCEYILRHDRYAAIREDAKDPSQVCPMKIGAATAIFAEIFAEVAALHPSKYFHIGADETYLLGKCRNCAGVAAAEGKSRLFVDYVKAMSKIVVDMGKTPVIWADIILKYPEAVAELPEELIFVDWNYGWDVDKFGKLDNLRAAGVKMWGASAMRSHPDNIYLTQWEKHFDNLSTFVPFARRSGYTGMIQTSWSTSGGYGFHYDTGYEIINMQPVRLVYPQSAFNILIAATAKAFNQAEPVDPKAFVKEYVRENYGLGEKEAQVLWGYFTMPQESVYSRTGKDAKGTLVGDLIDACIKLRGEVAQCRPRQNKKDFDHYALMLDLRINYLQFKEIETIFESPSYDRGQAAELALRLGKVVGEGRALDKRFTELNRGYIKDGELEYMIGFRGEKMSALYDRLKNNIE